jgi:ferric-dicitrate binding protein FerR (iron transport regulator)
MSDALDRMLREAQRDWAIEAKTVRWGSVESGLFGRIATERRAERDVLSMGRGRAWTAAAAGLASAFAIGLVVWTTHETTLLEADHVLPVEDGTTITRVDGAGAVLVNGHAAAAGTALHPGDSIEARAAQATVSRPGKATFVIERGSTAVVTHLQGGIVLALSRGAIEAQVVPVATSEAMAIDVGRSRVAVHGTRFRVARMGEHVTVDLTEGVVTIGQAPRVGSTLGGLVTAPAHAEFVAADPESTLHVSHDVGSVRAATPFETAPQARPPALSISPVVPSGQSAVRADAGDVAAPGSAGASRSEQRPTANPSGWAPGSTTADPNAQAAIATAVRSCLGERMHVDSVTVVVSTTLVLQLHEDGTVSSARFEPPVAPDVNACSAESIYRARFTHGGTVSIPISVKN